MKKEVFLLSMSEMDDKGEYAVIRPGEPVDYDEFRTMCVEVHFNPNAQTVYGAFADAMAECLEQERIHAPEEIIGQLAERMKEAIKALNQVERCIEDYNKLEVL
jgi:hypothetical protein